ncbi:MAG TPA: Flp pilus assembly protein CpaB [Gaiellaceae bacterium]|nr:Flp pilus assembly protein CpaB [Gaiellaceae bacterium]
MTDYAFKNRELIGYRTRNILIATGLGLLAVVLTLVYVSHARKASPSAAASAPVTVLVAAKDIPVGTAGRALAGSGWLVTKSFPSADVPSGAVTNAAQLSQLVAIQPIYKGEALVGQRFGTTQQEGMLSLLHGAYRVVQLPGDANQLLAGTLKVGNTVDVVGSLKSPETSQNHYSTIFLRDLLVMSTPSKPSAGIGQTTSVELRVSESQAQRLFWLEKNADWSLLLRPATGASDKPFPAVSAGSLLESANGR